MQLYMKQKVFSFGDKFTVKDASGADRWFVQGEVFSLGKKLHIYDPSGQERAMLRQKLMSFMPRFFIDIDGDEVASIVKDFTFFKQHYRLEGMPWELEGDFWSHDYRLLDNGVPVMYVTKQWFSWGDSYLLDIVADTDELMCLCVVLAVDCVIDASRNSGN